MRLSLNHDQEFEARKLALMHAAAYAAHLGEEDTLRLASAYHAFLIGDDGRTPIAGLALDRAA